MSEQTEAVEVKSTAETLYGKGQEAEAVEAAAEATQTEVVAQEASTEKSEEKATEEAAEIKEIEYKLELGKESKLNEAVLEDVKAFALENKLTNEAAQLLLSKQEDAIQAYDQKLNDDYNKQVDAWREETLNHPVFGGEKIQETAENAKRVLEKFGDDGLIEILRDKGYGDHPVIVNFLSKIGRSMNEDKLIMADSVGSEKKSRAEILYGTKK